MKTVSKKAKLILDGKDILIPVKTPGKKNYSNLRRWQASNKVLYSLPECCSLYYYQWSKEGPVFVCEGEWDALALASIMIKAGFKEPCSIVAVPGANVFKQSWASKFKGRDVYFLYDNDHDKKRKVTNEIYNPGRDGMELARERLGSYPNTIHFIDWESLKPKAPDGYDIRDLFIEANKLGKVKVTWKKLLKSFVKMEKAKGSNTKRKSITSLPRKSFEEVIDDFRSRLEFNQTFVDVLACCFACIITLFMDHAKRSPLWMFIVAPPSTGKTTIIEAFGGLEDIALLVSDLTPASLVTGLNIGADEDMSLLAQLKNKVLFNEDFTPILNMGNNRDEIFGILRAAYNGDYTAHFARGTRTYEDLYFGLISGVTNAIERYEMGELGERFIRIRLVDENFNEDLHIEKALNNVDEIDESGGETKQFLQSSVLGFMNHLLKNKKQPTFDRKINSKLIPLASLRPLPNNSPQKP